MADGRRILVRFDLELCGNHEHGNTRLSPRCHLCQETYADLRRLAEWVLPKEQQP
jgi:hypothetical protein